MSVAINYAILFKNRASPTETVDSGEAYFWLEGTTLKYKDDTQTVNTLATGVTPEEVQDIVGSFLTAGSSKVAVVYNDGANTMTIDVVENQINHDNLLGFVANEHVDHSTVSITGGTGLTGGGDITANRTISMPNVGSAGTYGTTSAIPQITTDAQGRVTNVTEPSISITSSQVSNFNEAAQDAVGGILTDTSSVDLTYDDAGNTISAVVLPAGVNHNSLLNYVANEHINHTSVSIGAGTGLSGGGDISANRTLDIANTGVTAGTYGASGVPQFTVNAQGQLTSASNGPALVIGDNFEQFLDATTFTTTSNAEQVAATFTTASKATGTYRISVNWNWRISVNNIDAIFRIYLDGVQIDTEFRKEASETANQNFPYSWFFYTTFGSVSTHTIQLRTLNEVPGPTISVFVVRAEIWRVS